MIPKRVTIHCSDSPNGRQVEVSEIRAWHQAKKWSDIGYHYVIYPDGRVMNGRPIQKMGAHVEGANKDNVGICLNGKTKFSREQFDGLRSLLDRLLANYNIMPNDIYCHYEFESAKKKGKTCPNMKGDDLRSWYIEEDESLIKKYLIEG